MSAIRIRILFTAMMALAAAACDTGEPLPVPATASPAISRPPAAMPGPVVAEAPVAAAAAPLSHNTQFELGDTRILFVTQFHSESELEALLHRADEIARTSPDGPGQTQIALVVHGPSIEHFRQKNYTRNKALIDLAARLDALNVMDVKICEFSLNKAGIPRSEIPAFIESVPFAPDEIRRLTEAGYVTL
ncbi:MAG: hypothetical protein HYY36_07360 [Gammaproteobacteria bacterium]|nr:hypothetical protein [Gammaproteobacteria bacterium]